MILNAIPKELHKELQALFWALCKNDPELKLRVHHEVWNTVCIVWLMREMLKLRGWIDEDETPTGVHTACPS